MNDDLIVDRSADVIKVEDIKVGCFVQGKEVSIIHTIGSTYAIYEFKDDDSVRYMHSDNERFSESLAKLEKFMISANQRFMGRRKDILNQMFLSSARRIFHGANKKEVDNLLWEMKVEINKTPSVSRLIGNEKNFSIWQNENGSIGYSFSEELEGVENAIAEFTRVKSLADAMLPAKNHKKFYYRLGSALYVALKLKDGVGSVTKISAFEKVIIDASKNEVKLKILVITSGVAVIFMVISVLLYYLSNLPEFIRMSIVCATGGLAGALISFLERSKKSNVGESDFAPLVVLSSVSRILIGGLFGVIAYSVANAELAFSLFKSSKPALLILGVAAGFSERLIPDVLGSISVSNGEGEKKNDNYLMSQDQDQDIN